MTDNKIINQFNDYIRSRIEVPHDNFHGMPICPFAKAARLADKIEYVVTKDFSPSTLILYINDWLKYDTETDVLIVIHPSDKAVPFDMLQSLADFLCSEYRGVAEIFAGHPSSTTTFNGVLTRMDPWPNLQVNRTSDLREARAELQKTRYYG